MSLYGQYIPSNRQRAIASAPSLATEAQQAFIAKLEAEGRTADCSTVKAYNTTGTKSAASQYISDMLASAKGERKFSNSAAPAQAVVPAEKKPAEAGMYRKGADIYRVKIGKESGQPYAAKLVAISGNRLVDADESIIKYEFQFERGAIYSLSSDNKLTLEEAKQFGIRTGTCCVCSKLLTDAKSVLAGIGPKCAKNF
jgi:hypothetical protein